MKEITGVVVSVRVYWQRDHTGRPQRRQRIRVEYSDGADTRLITGTSRPGGEVRTGDHVTVLLQPGRPAAIVPVPAERPARNTRQVRGGLLAFAGLVALVLLVSGAVWFRAMSGPDRYPPPVPRTSPDVAPTSTVPSLPGESGTSGR